MQRNDEQTQFEFLFIHVVVHLVVYISLFQITLLLPSPSSWLLFFFYFTSLSSPDFISTFCAFNWVLTETFAQKQIYTHTHPYNRGRKIHPYNNQKEIIKKIPFNIKQMSIKPILALSICLHVCACLFLCVYVFDWIFSYFFFFSFIAIDLKINRILLNLCSFRSVIQSRESSL